MPRGPASARRKPQLVALDWAPRGSVVPEGLVLSRARFSETEIAAWKKLVWEVVRDGTFARIARRHVPEDEVAEMIPRDDLSR
jgi:hypothetical protein